MIVLEFKALALLSAA